MADCIPAGMESFVATDEEQFNVIKKVIDLCDYYILILGKRYGSVNETTGLSYTEMEYNYAMDKGIPVLVFAIDDSISLSDDKIESDDVKKGKLAEFKSRAMSNRLASIWKDSADLMGKVAISIMLAKNEIKRPGWHRGNDTELEQLKKELALEKSLNEELRKQVAMIPVSSTNSAEMDYAFLDKPIELHYTEKVFIFTTDTVINKKVIHTTVGELFKYASLNITSNTKISTFIDVISGFQQGYYVDKQDALVVRNKFEQLMLIESFSGKDDVEMIRLTDKGRDIMNKLNSVED